MEEIENTFTENFEYHIWLIRQSSYRWQFPIFKFLEQAKNLWAYLMNGGIISGLKAPTLASTNITWEKVYTTNIGLDWTMLNGRFTGSFDYYIRDTKGMVVNKTYPAVLGTTGGKENLADMRTKGMELSLTWNDQIKDVAGSPLDYSISIGISDNTSEITKYDNPTLSLDENSLPGRVQPYVAFHCTLEEQT